MTFGIPSPSGQDRRVDLEMFSQAAWDKRYAESHRIWSGQPNQRLVEQVAGLTPGTALDVGCGEGADAVWLAQQGWQATGIDVSEVALERARQHAADAGVEVAWEQVDLMKDPPPGQHDLVSVFFMHVPEEVFDEFYQRLASAVAPEGHLLVVGHHPDDEHLRNHGGHGPSMLFAPERVVAALAPGDWQIVTAAAPTRTMLREEQELEVTDSILLARRR